MFLQQASYTPSFGGLGFTLDKLTDPDIANTWNGDFIKPFYDSSRVVDDGTVVVNTQFPTTAFLQWLAMNWFTMIPKHHFENMSLEDMKLEENALGSGPFKLVEFNSGVCHSDLHFVEGLYPLTPPAVLGHEVAGIVEEVGELVAYVRPGDHVIAFTPAFCGSCGQCLTGYPNRCSERPARAPSDPPKLVLAGSGHCDSLC